MATIFDTFLNSQVFGVPIPIIAVIMLIGFVIYLIITRRPRVKEFKPMDLKKETRKRYNSQFKFFGVKYNKPIYNINENKPFGWVIGYMKAVWMEQFKRYEPIHVSYNKLQFETKLETSAQEVYKMPFDKLNDIQKKNIHELAKEELRDETVHIEKAGEKIKIVRGKKEVKYSIPIPCFMIKMARSDFLHKLMAKLFGVGTNWFIFNSNQLTFEDKGLRLNANYQCKGFNDTFVFSNAGKNIVEDICFGVERENVLQETANQIPRVIHFDTEASKAITFRREDAKILAERYKAQKEASE